LKTCNVVVQERLPILGSKYLEYTYQDQKYNNENLDNYRNNGTRIMNRAESDQYTISNKQNPSFNRVNESQRANS
jgi:hypothetical protein